MSPAWRSQSSRVDLSYLRQSVGLYPGKVSKSVDAPLTSIIMNLMSYCSEACSGGIVNEQRSRSSLGV